MTADAGHRHVAARAHEVAQRELGPEARELKHAQVLLYEIPPAQRERAPHLELVHERERAGVLLLRMFWVKKI